MKSFLVLFFTLCAWLPALAAENNRTFTIAYINLADDPRHGDFTGYANIVLRSAADPYAGAQTAAQEGKVLGRALGIDIDLARTEAADATRMVDAIRGGYERGVRFFLVDAPGEILAVVAAQTRDLDAMLFNVTSPFQPLRSDACERHMLHTYPSQAMLADALAQFAVSMNWDDVLALHGPRAEDRDKANAFIAAARRFGLDIVDTRTFSQDNNPRERDRNNIALLTQGDYDAIYVADASLGVGRFVPYQSKHPRPVIGDAGLVADAWHWTAERYGAPQLNQRFARIAGRKMNGKDWSAWAAVRVLLDALRATQSTDFALLSEYVRGESLNLDTYKGSPGSFRPWNGQLRQPIVLHTDNAATAYAPFEGFLHPDQNLDTLGNDRAESKCGTTR